MTSFATFPPRNRDMQDGAERHVWGEQEYIDGAGSVVRARGTGSEDIEAPVLNNGSSFNLAKNSNAEVILLALGSDTNMKFAMLTIPRDKQRKWAEGRGGIQNPTDPDHALEFRDGRLHLTKGTLTTEGGTFEVRDGQVYFRGNMTVTGTVTANGGVVASSYAIGTDPNVPPATS